MLYWTQGRLAKKCLTGHVHKVTNIIKDNMFRAETEIPILTMKMFITHASKGRIPVPNLMNFRKNFEGGGSFPIRKISLRFFDKEKGWGRCTPKNYIKYKTHFKLEVMILCQGVSKILTTNRI